MMELSLQKDTISIGRDVSIIPTVAPHFLAVGQVEAGPSLETWLMVSVCRTSQ